MSAKQQILILISGQPADGPTAQAYKQHARPGQEVTVRRLDSFFVAWDGAQLQVIDPHNAVKLEAFDTVYFAGWQADSEMAYCMACWLQSHHIPFVGRTILDLYPATKAGEMAQLILNHIPYVRSFFAADPRRLAELYDWAQQHCNLTFPVIVKSTTASKGEANFLVRSRQTLADLPIDTECRYLLQEYIPNTGDYRLVVINSRPQVVIRRVRSDPATHLNNTSQGAQASLVPLTQLPAGLATLAVAAAKALRRTDICGVDLLVSASTGQPYVLEVNKTPYMALGAPEGVDAKLEVLYKHIEQMAAMRTSVRPLSA